MGVMDSFAAHLLLRLQLKNEEMKAGLADTKRAADQAMKGVADATQKASDEQKKLGEEVDKVGDALDNSAGKATTWAGRVSEAFAKGLDTFEKGVGHFGDAAKTVGEVFEKSERVAKELGIQIDADILKFGRLAKNVGELAIEAAKLPGIIQQISAATGMSIAQLGAIGAAGAAGVGIGTYLNQEVIGEHALRDFVGRGGDGHSDDDYAKIANSKEANANARRRRVAARQQYAQGLSAQQRFMAYWAQMTGAGELEIEALEARPQKKGGGIGSVDWSQISYEGPDVALKKSLGWGVPSGAGGYASLGLQGIDVDDRSAKALTSAEMFTQKLALESSKIRVAEEKSLFKSIFGEPEELDLYAEKLETVSGVIDVLSGALQQSFDAWVSGSQTAGEALKALPKAVLGGISSMMWAKGLQHGAEALEALIPGVMFNPAAAAGHAKVAAVFAAGAIAVGGVARQFGGTAPGAGAGAGSGAGAYGGGGGSPAPGPTNIVYIRDSSARKSDRWFEKEAAEDFDRIQRYRNTGGNVVIR